MKTRRIAWAVLVLLLCASFLSIVAFASSFSDGSGGTVELEVTNADVSSDGILTKRIYGSQKTSFGITSGQREDVTITIKNNNAFDVKLSGPMTFNIVGGKFQLSGTGYYKINSESEVKKENCTDVINADYIIEAGKSMTIKLTSPGGNDCYTEISWPIVAKKYVTYDINFAPAEHGSYAVDGVAITETTTKGIEGATGAELSATPDEGYVCVGFADATTGKMVLGMDSTQTTTFYPGSSMTIVPVFVQGLTETPYLIGTDSYYYTWESAMVAGRGGIVILNQNYTLPTTLTENGLTAAGNYVTGTDGALTYTVPTGTSLLVPYDSNNVFRGVATRYTLEKMDLQATDFPTSPEHSIIWVRAEAENPPTEYRRLTLPANTHLVVNGSLEVSGQSQALGKGHWGKYGLIQMEQGSKITVNNGATLFSWGFIRGNGTVEAMPGSSVYEPFSIADYPAGGVGTMNDMNNNNILAFKEYTVHGVEVPLTIHYNTSHYIYFCISGYNVGYNTYHVPFAGNNDTSLIKLAEGATLTKSYKDGRMQLTFSGDATFNAFTIEISALIYTYKLDINKTGFAVSSSWDVLIKGGSDVVSKVSMPLLAGSNVTIEEGATLEIASGKNFYIFDAEDDPSNATADAKLDVNGTVVVNGGLYTTTNGAEITSSKGTGKVIQNTQGTATSVAIMKDNASSDTYAINQAWLLNGDNTTYVKTADNTTIPNTYTYTDEKWVCETHTPGEWVTDSEPTCAVVGSQHTTCTVCHTVVTETIPALSHSWSDATCTAPKTCSVCKTTEGEALGHTWVDADCDTPKTCSVCGATEGEALGHTWVDADCDTPKTCSVCGATEGAALGHTWADADCDTPKTCSVCGATEGEALGHKWNDATCTTPKTCSVCGATEGEALGHTWADATCDTPKTCSACGATEGEALGHKWNDATCTTPKTCSVCGAAEGEALGHNWTDATCTTPKICSVCKATEGEALGHTWVDADCDTPKTCSVCGATEGEALGHTWVDADCDTPKTCSVCKTTEGEALGHSFTNYVSNGDATCTADGTETAKCDRCNVTDTRTDADSKLNHSFTKYEPNGDATCTADGTKTAKCDRCDATDIVADEGSALEHRFTNYVYDGIEKGTATAVCGNGCGATDTKEVTLPEAEVKSLGKITVGPEGKYAFEDSYYVYDLIGGTGLSDSSEPFDMTIAMEFVAKETAEQAAENFFGNYTTDFFITLNGMANGSFVGDGCYLAGYYPNFGEWVKIPLDEFTVKNGVVYPVITSAGFDFKYVDICASVEQFICGIYIAPKILEANPDLSVTLSLGLSEDKEAAQSANFITVDSYTYNSDQLHVHTYDAVVTEPTCTAAGVKTYTCTCGDSYTEEIAATGHNYVDGLCSVCGEADETELTDEKLKFLSTSMNLAAYIGAQFEIDPEAVEAGEYDSVYVSLTGSGVDVILNENIAVKLTTEAGLQRYVFEYGLAAKKMANEYSLTIYGVKGEYIYKGETTVWSIKEEVLDQLQTYYPYIKYPQYKNRCVMLVDLLNYGSAAQIRFEYETDNLANADLKDEYLNLATATDPMISPINTATSTSVHELYTYSLGMEERVELQFTFRLNSTEYEKYTIKVTWNDKTYEYTGDDLVPMTGYPKFVTAVFDKLESKNMRDTVIVELYKDGIQVSQTYTASIEGTAKLQIDAGRNIDVIKAMLKFGDAAVVAFS